MARGDGGLIMEGYTITIFEPDCFDSTCVIMYYCYYGRGNNHPSESTWVVPGTFDLEA